MLTDKQGKRETRHYALESKITGLTPLSIAVKILVVNIRRRLYSQRPSWTWCLLFFGLMSLDEASAQTWKREPQPVVAGPRANRYELLADARSGLAFDSAWKVLFHPINGWLNGHFWNGRHFAQIRYANVDQHYQLKPESALVMDEGWHYLYFVDREDRVRVCRRTRAGWVQEPTVDEPLTQLLGVDEKWHILFAYSEVKQAVMAIRWSVTESRWVSEPILENVGTPGSEGAVDRVNHVLYTTHATWQAGDTTQPLVPGSEPTGGNEWPLVATWWNGSTWQSRKLTDTGVPQRPAWDTLRKRLYFARWDGSINWIGMGRAGTVLATNPGVNETGDVAGTVPRSSSFTQGSLTNTQPDDSWVDHQNYVINYNQRPYWGWGGFGTSTNTGGFTWTTFTLNPILIPRTWEKVPAYLPSWQQTPLPARISSWNGIAASRRGELLVQQSTHDAGDLLTATGWQEVTELYRTSNGLYFLWSPDWADDLSDEALTARTELFDGRRLPRADMLSSESPSTYYGTATLDRASKSLARLLSTDAVLSNNAPLPPTRLGPTLAEVRTQGVKLNGTGVAAGERYRQYEPQAVNRAWTGGLAMDRRSRVAFYTQAPQVNLGSPAASTSVHPWWPLRTVGHPVSEFDPSVPDPKLLDEGLVWISILR
jgi:hypothetical protein